MILPCHTLENYCSGKLGGDWGWWDGGIGSDGSARIFLGSNAKTTGDQPITTHGGNEPSLLKRREQSDENLELRHGDDG